MTPTNRRNPSPAISFSAASENAVAPRARLRRTRVGTREKIIAALLGLLFVEAPWFLGGINTTAQFVNLGIALAAFAALFVPLADPDSPTPAQNLRALLRFPPFWGVVIFLGYLLAQYLNPHLAFTRGELNGQKGWWLAPLEYVAWLPSGIKSPYVPMNPLRFLVVWATPLTAMCALFLGVRRMKSWRVLTRVCVFNACLVALVGLALQFNGATHVLGFIGKARASFFGAFAYTNHAAIFIYLNLALALGIFLNRRRAAMEDGDGSGRYWLWLFPILVLVGGVLGTGSRMGSAYMLALCGAAIVIALGGSLRLGLGGFVRTLCGILALAALFGGGAAVLFQEKLPKAFERFESLNSKSDLKMRAQLVKLSRDVFEARPIQGWGAGAYRYVSQPYSKKYDFPYAPWAPKEKGRQTWYAAHGHCDWLEFPADLGILGCLPLVFIGTYWLVQILRRVRWMPPGAWMGLSALAALAAHAALDFPMSCPAVQLAALFVLCLAAFRARHASRTRTVA